MIKLTSVLKEYPDKVINQLLAIYQPQTDLTEEEIRNYINRFDSIKDKLRQKFKANDPLAVALIPADLKEKDKYLNVLNWKNFELFKRVIDGMSKKPEDIYKQAIEYYKKAYVNIDETVIKNYVARFKRRVPDLKRAVQAEDPDIMPLVPKELLSKDRYANILNWRKFEELEALLDEGFPETSGEKGELNSAETDADLVYAKEPIEIFKGDSEHKCIRYGKNRYYGWCISATMYSSYRFSDTRTSRMFYFVFDKSKPDTKTSNDQDSFRKDFTDPYHAVVIHVLENGKYIRTLADNRGDAPYDGTTWEGLGQHFEGPSGKDLWNKIKGLESVFKYISPSKEELRQAALSGKKLTIEQFSELPYEDKIQYVRVNAAKENVLTADLFKTLDKDLKNEAINNDRKCSFEELKSNIGLLKRYPDYRFTRHPKDTLPYDFIPYLKEELQELYFDKFEEEYLTYELIEKYFKPSILEKYIGMVIDQMAYIPESARSKMTPDQQKLYDVYSLVQKDVTLFGYDQISESDRQAQNQIAIINEISRNTYKSFTPEERKKIINLYRDLGRSKENENQYASFFMGIPVCFVHNSNFYFVMPIQKDTYDYVIVDEDGNERNPGGWKSVTFMLGNKDLEKSDITTRQLGKSTMWIPENEWDRVRLKDSRNEERAYSKADFLGQLREASRDDYRLKRLSGIIK